MLFWILVGICIVVGLGGTAVQILMHMLPRDYRIDEWWR